MKQLVPGLSLLFFLFILFSCKSKKEKEKDVKILTYEVEYREDRAGSVPTGILPNRMRLVFSRNLAVNQIEGFLGQFSLRYLADLRNQEVTTLLRLFDKKYYYIGEKGELPCGIDPMEGLKILPAGNNPDILGFSTNYFDLILPGGDTLELASTEDLGIESPNITTPYRDVDEVLLQFYTKLSVLEMVLKAVEFEETRLPADFFEIPEDYQRINRATMEKAIDELFK